MDDVKVYADYVKVFAGDDRIDVWFYNEHDKTLAIGEKMYAINDSAYMNGYNWEALFHYYLAKHDPDILVGLDSDPEAGSYVAYFEPTEENAKRAERFAQIIVSLVENEEMLYQLVRDKGDKIEWD